MHSKRAVNIHFGVVNETRNILSYLETLSFDDMLKFVLMATLKASANRDLRETHHKILDDLDDDQDLTFVLIQTARARQFRRRPDRIEDRRPDTPHRDKTDNKYLRQSKNGLEPYNKSTRPKAGDVAAFLCNFLGDYSVKPEKVLKKAGLDCANWEDPDSVHAVYKASTKFLPRTLRSDSDADSDAVASGDLSPLAASDSDDSQWCVCVLLLEYLLESVRVGGRG
jgi:hypothetical protein